MIPAPVADPMKAQPLLDRPVPRSAFVAPVAGVTIHVAATSPKHGPCDGIPHGALCLKRD
jgi:hypothetical protein